MTTGLQHQCQPPSIWVTRFTRTRLGREWICPTCETGWTYRNTTPSIGIPHAPDIYKWTPTK